jgi:hypothetical protein
MWVRSVSYDKNVVQLEVTGYIRYKQKYYKYRGILKDIGSTPPIWSISNNIEFILEYKNKAMHNLLYRCDVNLYQTVRLLIYQDIKKRIQKSTKISTDICECLLVPGNAWMRDILEGT